MSNPCKYIHPITMEAAVEAASNLTPADYKEVCEGHGLFPRFHIPISAMQGDSVVVQTPDGKTAAIGGVSEDGQIWLLSTPRIEEHPLALARDIKRFVDNRKEKLLWNIVDKRNTAHLKLLKFLGFKFLREFKYGPNQLTFIEFCRVRSRNWCSS